MNTYSLPTFFRQLQEQNCLAQAEIIHTHDGFSLAYRSLADMLAEKGILDFPDSEGRRLLCRNFFDDWFLYALPEGDSFVYGLLKLREQEHDQENGGLADGDTPGVTISFIAFDCGILLRCLQEPSDENRGNLNREINRVVARRGQRHHDALKRYFADPRSTAPYLVARMYASHIAAFAQSGSLAVPDQYRVLAQKFAAPGCSAKDARVPQFIISLNEKAGRVICDGEKLHIRDPKNPDEYEAAAILATHTGNTSLYSFAAEVEYHAKFLISIARIRIPFLGGSVYDSAIRADMTIGDTEFEGPAPFYRSDSKIVKRQYRLHHDHQPEPQNTKSAHFEKPK